MSSKERNRKNMKKINPTENKEWWHIQTPSTKDLAILTSVYNEKYGKKHNGLDLRLHNTSFAITFTTILKQFENAREVLVVGANDGYEITFIKNILPSAKITALDVSTVALKKLQANFPEVVIVHGGMEKTAFSDKEFDLYVSCRSINSTNVNIINATKEAVRISKNIVISVSNGYLIDGKLQKGMFDYETGQFNLEKPYEMIDYINMELKSKKYRTLQKDCSSELFIVTKP
jgi:ubiquinone/menaquinone biosynthesis C-methylase UbiE